MDRRGDNQVVAQGASAVRYEKRCHVATKRDSFHPWPKRYARRA